MPHYTAGTWIALVWHLFLALNLWYFFCLRPALRYLKALPRT